jgi:RNA polymerase sigma-70 factor, ECF subfamily
VARVRRGEGDAFDVLTRRYLRSAYAVALAVVGRPADAEDVAQDALVAAFERIGTCRDPERFAAWLMQIVRNRARNWCDARRLRDVTATGELPEAAVEAAAPQDAALRDGIVAALGELKEVEREIVLLHDLDGWVHREIGEILGISEVMSRQHLFNARGKLRKLLARHGAEEPER